MSNIKEDYSVNLEAKCKPFQYQAEAFLTLKDLPYSAIFHEQGLGKTKIAIDLMLYWLKNKNIDTVLVVSKKQLISNWQKELGNHSFLKPKILTNNKAQNFYVLNSPTKVIVTNFETISTEKERIELFLKTRSVAIIVDESTKLKNPESKLTRDFFDISDLFKIKTIMTGTPVANRPYDIWSQVYFLDKGNALGKDFETFKRQTNLQNNFKDNEDSRNIFEDKVSSIFANLSSFSVRETKKSCGIKLPNKKYETIYADYEKKQKNIYYSVIKDMQVEVISNGKSILDDDSESLKRLLRLNQIASNPKLIDDSYNEISGKEIVLDDLLKNIINRNEKCIIWTSYIENVNYFTKRYQKFGSCKIHGGMTIDDRNKSVEKFIGDDDCKILFATPQAAKEGLTLTVANNAIFYDRTFNLDDYLQSQDRIHRISQTKECNIYNIMIRDSIDDWIDALLNAKQYAAFLAQGDITREQYEEIADYSYGEIIKNILQTGGVQNDK